ncbi:MAG TPA: hypothetical protein VEI25_20385 [Paraburkholderia sp.]|nr:hypothetical protein [Paraburkholderia sp.]
MHAFREWAQIQPDDRAREPVAGGGEDGVAGLGGERHGGAGEDSQCGILAAMPGPLGPLLVLHSNGVLARQASRIHGRDALIHVLV